MRTLGIYRYDVWFKAKDLRQAQQIFKVVAKFERELNRKLVKDRKRAKK